jgi:hypothetical protein
MPWIAAGGAVVSGLIGSSGAKSAAKAQAKAAQQAAAESGRQFDLTRTDMKPWMNVGEEGLYTLAEMLGLGTQAQLSGVGKPVMPNQDAYYRNEQVWTKPTIEGNGRGTVLSGGGMTTNRVFDQARYDAALNKYNGDLSAWNNSASAQSSPEYGSLLKDFTLEDFQEDPGYQFRQQQGEQALMRRASANGSRLSPSTMKDLLRFNSDLSSQEFGNAFNRDATNKARKFNFLGQISGVGQTAATQIGQFGAQNANAMGAANMAGANATAAGTMGQANAWGNAIGQAANAWQQNRALDKYLQRGNDMNQYMP